MHWKVEGHTVKTLKFEIGGGCLTPPTPMVVPQLAWISFNYVHFPTAQCKCTREHCVWLLAYASKTEYSDCTLSYEYDIPLEKSVQEWISYCYQAPPPLFVWGKTTKMGISQTCDIVTATAFSFVVGLHKDAKRCIQRTKLTNLFVWPMLRVHCKNLNGKWSWNYSLSLQLHRL